MSQNILASTNLIPDKLINAAIYLDTNVLLGIATVTLPELSYMTESLEGLGIAGPVEIPVIGHFQNMTTSFSWNTITTEALTLLKTKGHQLNIRASVQQYDAGTGKQIAQQVRLVMNVLPKKLSLGKTEAGKKMDNETELEVIYLKLWIGGDEVLEIDKINFICSILGEDMLAEVRQHLGKGE